MKLSTSIDYTLALHNGKASQPLIAGQHNTIRAKAGEHYRILKKQVNEEQLLDDVIAKKTGEDLQLQYADGTKVTLENYFQECKTASACEVTLPGQGQGVHSISGKETNGVALGDGSTLVYGHGSQDALQSMAQGNNAMTTALSASKGNEISYIPATPAAAAPVAPASEGISMSMLGVLASPLALLGVGGGGVAAAAAAVHNIVSVAVVAGPVVAGNGLTIYLFQADGTTLITSGTVGATGSCTLDVGSYTGVVIAKVTDSGAGVDYMDEATGQSRDLNANLMALGVASSGTVSLNINALTTVAALNAGAVFGNGVGGAGASTSTITTTTVAQHNAAVADAFNLTDLHGSIVTTINSSGAANANYTPALLSDAEKYGAALAALSGVDSANGGNMQTTINSLKDGLIVSGSTGTLNATASDAIIQGAMTASAITSGSGSSNLTAITSDLITQTSASVSIDTVTTDNTINASEQGSTTITGANAPGATVSLTFSDSSNVNHPAEVNGTTWSYTLTGGDIDAMGQGSETITATATLAGNNSVATRSIVVSTVTPTISSVAISSATGIQNSTLNTGDVVSVTVTMSEPTVVTGMPQLPLNIGGTTVQADYASGSGTSALVFTYTIQAGKTDADGISIAADSLKLNGGTLTNAAGNSATLTHSAVTDNASYLVDTTAPTATAAITTVTDDAGPLPPGGITNDTSLDLAGTITGTFNEGEVVAVHKGPTKLGNAIINGNNWSYTDSTLASDESLGYTVRVGDAAGNTGIPSDTFICTISNPPRILNASFTENTNASISITFDEKVTAQNTNGLTIYRLDALSGLVNPSVITPTGISGTGTTTLTIATSSTLGSDIVWLSYSADSGNVTDMNGNALVSGEIFIGGSGVNNINLDSLNLDLTNPIFLFGNGGADILVGMDAVSYIFDGEGADTISGAQGATIHLIENGTDKAYASDTIKIALGDSPADSITSVDLITGFDAKSATAADHDVLDLQYNTIAESAINIDGVNVGLFATHSITSGIISFKSGGDNAILVDMNNANDAVAYLATNINSSGATMAFEIDTDNNGSADSLAVFQDNGVALLDTVVVLDGVTGITLGTVIGTNVVQII